MKDTVFEFAEQKLAGVWPPPREDASLAEIAVLACRLLLDFEPSRQSARRTQAQLVERRMAIAYSVPGHGEYMLSGYPSEPLLAEAAARRMAKIRAHATRLGSAAGVVIPDLVLTHIESGLVDKGERGELVARLLLMLAQDKTVEAQHEKARQSRQAHEDVLYSTEVPVNEFMQTLFPHAWDEIGSSQPDNCPNGEKFEEAFIDAVVRFTHFGRVGDDYAASSAGACAAFIRCMAIQCRPGQFVIDMILPVLLSRSADVDERAMSGILISIRDRIAASTKARAQIDESEIPFFPKTEEADSRPYIVLVLDFGIRPPVPESAKVPTKRKEPEKPTPSASQRKKLRVSKASSAAVDALSPGSPSQILVSASDVPSSGRQAEAAPKVHPRYAIFAHGCSPTVYGVVENKDTFALLLASRDFLAEHPRQDPQCIDAVRRMKALWTAGPQCYDWFDNPFLNQGDLVPAARLEGVSTNGPLMSEEATPDPDDQDAEAMDVEK
jgi:hypothetical protein